MAAEVGLRKVGISGSGTQRLSSVSRLSRRLFTCDEEVERATITCLMQQDIRCVRQGLTDISQAVTQGSVVKGTVLREFSGKTSPLCSVINRIYIIVESNTLFY
jgi:hypothetical protein